MAPTFVTGKFDLVGSELRKQGLNRIGNLIIPNNNYCLFEEWIMPILDSMLEEQKATSKSDEPTIWTPQKMIARLGKVFFRFFFFFFSLV
jgi:deoxyhypusine synthase